MPDVYLCGHGSWEVIGLASVFVTIPPFTEVVFYKDIGEELDLTEAEAILRGDANAPTAVRTVSGTSFQSCPDMAIFPSQYEAEFTAAAEAGGVQDQVRFATRECRLSDLADELSGSRIHWLACSVRGLG